MRGSIPCPGAGLRSPAGVPLRVQAVGLCVEVVAPAGDAGLPHLQAAPGQQPADGQGHQNADGGIENTVEGVGNIGIHRGVEEQDAQHHAAGLHTAQPEHLAEHHQQHRAHKGEAYQQQGVAAIGHEQKVQAEQQRLEAVTGQVAQAEQSLADAKAAAEKQKKKLEFNCLSLMKNLQDTSRHLLK